VSKILDDPRMNVDSRECELYKYEFCELRVATRFAPALPTLRLLALVVDGGWRASQWNPRMRPGGIAVPK
jgi:hypothetical protein